MSKPYLLVILAVTSLPFWGIAQHNQSGENHHSEAEFPHFRAAILIGHTLIPEQHAGENFFIPSWGIDFEYWFDKEWGIGLHSDLELETFVLLRENGEEEGLERVSPLVLTLDALYKPWKGLVLQFGPGIEFEKEENYTLLRAGVEYEFDLNHHWDICPTIFYDTRFSEYHTWSIALGVGKRF